MLGHSEIDIEVSDTGIETVKSNYCREISRDNRDANCVLITIQKEVRFSYKDK